MYHEDQRENRCNRRDSNKKGMDTIAKTPLKRTEAPSGKNKKNYRVERRVGKLCKEAPVEGHRSTFPPIIRIKGKQAPRSQRAICYTSAIYTIIERKKIFLIIIHI